MTYRFIVFLLLNFSALAIGGMYTGKGVASDWYAGISKAPWTPPGWVFGAAWTGIMICFALYMSYLWQMQADKKLLVILFFVQWVLNVSWNPVFFHFRLVFSALIIITLLTILIGIMLLYYTKAMHAKSLFILPYFLWLIIASSLNAYIWFRN